MPLRTADKRHTVTFNSTARHLHISPESAENFSAHMEAAFLFFFVRRFSPKAREQAKSPRKVYAVDTGLANVVGTRLSRNDGAALENFIYLELAKRAVFDPRMQVHHWKDERQKEVDFLVQAPSEQPALIQACWSREAPRTREREVSALLGAMEALGTASGLVITSEEDATEERCGRTIRFVPAWKWASGVPLE